MSNLSDEAIIEETIRLVYRKEVWDALATHRKEYVLGRTREMKELYDRAERLEQEFAEALSDDEDWYERNFNDAE